VSQNHDDIAARLRDEASATAPERLRADVMMRVRAEPRPQRIRPRRRSFGRSVATVAAAACILGAMVFGLSRVDFGGSTSSSGGAGATSAPLKAAEANGAGGGVVAAPPGPTVKRGLAYQAERQGSKAVQALTAVPRPLKAAIYGRYHLAAPLREAFGAIDPHHGPNRR
jgi:negative regulator of sigma E activity